MTTRRDFLMAGAAGALVTMLGGRALAEELPPISPVGISSTAMAMHLFGGGGPGGPGGAPGGPGAAPARPDSVAVVEYCRSLGAGGLQFTPQGDLKAVRARMEQLGMWYEGEARAPRTDADLDALEKSLEAVKEMGGTVARCVSPAPPRSSGRRYETFTSGEEFRAWLEAANAMLIACEPVARRVGVRLAFENHKDRTSEEFADILKKVSSECVGATVDAGNNMSMLEDPVETCTRLAPYANAVHMKDMAVAPYEDGFLLSEVRFGTGVTDQAALWKILKKANPRLNFVHELITRDPLKVPYFKDVYWATYPEKRAGLDEHVAWVKAHAQELPVVSTLTPEQRLQAEEDNNRQVIDWGRTNIV